MSGGKSDLCVRLKEIIQEQDPIARAALVRRLAECDAHHQTILAIDRRLRIVASQSDLGGTRQG